MAEATKKLENQAKRRLKASKLAEKVGAEKLSKNLQQRAIEKFTKAGNFEEAAKIYDKLGDKPHAAAFRNLAKKQKQVENSFEISKNGSNTQKIELAGRLKYYENDLWMSANQALEVAANLFKYGDKSTQMKVISSIDYVKVDKESERDSFFKAMEAGIRYGDMEVQYRCVQKLSRGEYKVPLNHRAELKQLGVKISADGIADSRAWANENGVGYTY